MVYDRHFFEDRVNIYSGIFFVIAKSWLDCKCKLPFTPVFRTYNSV